MKNIISSMLLAMTCCSPAYAEIYEEQRGEWLVIELTGEDIICLPADTYPNGFIDIANEKGLLFVYGPEFEVHSELGDVYVGILGDKYEYALATYSENYAYVPVTDEVCFTGFATKVQETY